MSYKSMIDGKFVNGLKNCIPEKNIYLDEDMSKRVSFKTGGRAKFLVEVDRYESLVAVLKLVKEFKEKYVILGNGSNTIFRGGIYDGVVVAISDCGLKEDFFNMKIIDGTDVEVGAGVKNSTFSKFLLDNSMEGFEFAAGIPGTIGGAIYMNAGAYGGEIKDIIKRVLVYSYDGDEICWLDKNELRLSYRKSRFMDGSEVILSAVFEFQRGDSNNILEKIKDLNRRRLEKQPLEYPSAGSFFKRPEGYYAGKLIEDAGLCGFSVGGAKISEKHCGFVVNFDNATTEDIMKLMKHCQDTVEKKFGVKLEPEPRII